MFVRVYTFHIQKGKEEKYLTIQKRTEKIYKKYLDFQTIYLKSKEDNTKWMEINRYKNEEDYKKSIEQINKEQDIQELFKEFQSILVKGGEIIEENFVQLLQDDCANA